MTGYRWTVRVLLTIGLVESSAFLAAIMPLSWMAWAHAHLGLGSMPSSPVFEPVMRQVSLVYAFHGLGVAFLATNVQRYLPFVKFSALGYLVAPLAFLWVDLTSDLPRALIMGNVIGCFMVGVPLAIAVFKESAKNQEP